ncbi:Kelch repeat-containing protein [Wenyingzhuangia sp. IMCC45574]
MKKILLLLVATTVIACTSNKFVVNNTSQKENFDFRLTQKADMPFPAYNFGAELYKGKIYTFLENPSKSYKSKKQEGSYGDVCVYDIKENAWSTVNTIPKTIKGASSAIIGHRIYLLGTYKGNIVQVYNIKTNAWEENIKMPFPFHFTTVETYKKKLYTIGGYAYGKDVRSKGVKILQDVFIYNTKTKKWTKGLPYPRKASGLSSLKYKNKFYVWSKSEAYQYNPKKSSWSVYEPLKDKLLYSQQGVELKKHFYFINGYASNSLVNPELSKKIYSYDTRKEVFQESLSETKKARKSGSRVFTYKSKIYMLGGKNGVDDKAMNDVVVLEIK